MRAIDTHVHPGTKEDVFDCGGKYIEDAFRFFGKKVEALTEEALAEEYQSLDIKGILLGWDAETNTGNKRLSNEYIAGLVKKYPKTFIGFAGVDPWKGKVAIREVEFAIRDLGLRGVKFQQAAQGFNPNDERFFPIYETIVKLNLPVIFHTGTTAVAAGSPGGKGITLEYCKPIPYMDNLAAWFPEMRIIMAHPSWPWHDDQLAILRHKGNTYMDLSGWAPKYFPESTVHNINTLVQDKAFFGTDFPMMTPERWLSEFAALPLKDSVRPKILLHNAAKLLGIELPSAQTAS